MNQTRAGVYLLILVFAFFGLLFSHAIKTETPLQPEQQVAQKVPYKQGEVLAGFFWMPSFFLKDSSTKQIVSGTSVKLVSTSPSVPFVSCGGQNPNNAYFEFCSDEKYYYISCTPEDLYAQPPPDSYKVFISKSGYDSKSVTLQTNDGPDSPTVLIEKADTSAPSTPTNLKTTSVKSTSATLSWTASTDNKAVKGYKIFRGNVQIYTTTGTSFTDSSLKADKKYSYFVKAYDAAGNVSGASNTITVTTTLTIKDVSLPKVFGGSSTNLSKIADPKKVKDLTIEVKGKNKIVWTEIVDLSSQDTANKFKSLNKYLKATTLGVIDLDSKSLKVLNKKATITMFSLPFVSTPKVLVDGKEDLEVVSGIGYKDGTLNFKTAHFSKLEAVPTLKITEPQNSFQTQEPEITLKGVVTDPQAKVKASLNNKDLGQLKVAIQSGQFNKPITLIEGFNLIVVSAESSFGATLSVTVSGEFIPKKFNHLWVVGPAVVLLIVALGGGVYYWYKKRKGKTPPPEKPQPKPPTPPEQSLE